jgi:hypothetical protein
VVGELMYTVQLVLHHHSCWYLKFAGAAGLLGNKFRK